jgi:hypothetical protein
MKDQSIHGSTPEVICYWWTRKRGLASGRDHRIWHQTDKPQWWFITRKKSSLKQMRLHWNTRWPLLEFAQLSTLSISSTMLTVRTTWFNIKMLCSFPARCIHVVHLLCNGDVCIFRETETEFLNITSMNFSLQKVSVPEQWEHVVLPIGGRNSRGVTCVAQEVMCLAIVRPRIISNPYCRSDKAPT